MVTQKTIVVLLIVAIVLSVVSIALTLSVNMTEIKNLVTGTSATTGGVTNSANAGNVQLIVGKSGA